MAVGKHYCCLIHCTKGNTHLRESNEKHGRSIVSALADSLALKKNKKEPHEPLVTPMSKSYLLPAKKVWQFGNVTVVFDGGYLTHSTKENIHLRESNEKQRRSIVPALANSLAVKKNELFMNKHNKQEFPLMLRSQVYDL